MKKLLFILIGLSSLVYAQNVEAMYKGYISSPTIQMLADNEGNKHIDDLSSFELKDGPTLTECIVYEQSLNAIVLLCLEKKGKSLFVKIEGITLRDNIIQIESPYFLAYEISVEQITKDFMQNQRLLR